MRFAVILFLCQVLLAQQDFRGRIFDVQSKQGIQNLEIKLTPPKNAPKLPIRFANSDRNGEFRFSQLKPSRYLLEVSQGAYLLYRTEVDTTVRKDIQIPLKRR